MYFARHPPILCILCVLQKSDVRAEKTNQFSSDRFGVSAQPLFQQSDEGTSSSLLITCIKDHKHFQRLVADADAATPSSNTRCYTHPSNGHFFVKRVTDPNLVDNRSCCYQSGSVIPAATFLPPNPRLAQL